MSSTVNEFRHSPEPTMPDSSPGAGGVNSAAGAGRITVDEVVTLRSRAATVDDLDAYS